MFRDHSSATALHDPGSRTHPFCTVTEAVLEVRAGRMVVVCDDEGPAAQGAIAMAAVHATAGGVNFMVSHARGVVGLAITTERCLDLALPPMTHRDSADRDEAPRGTAFTVSIEARDGVTTGISAADRARTIRVAVDPGTGPADIVRPGHVFPLRARPGGVLVRRGQTEAAVDLARLAGLTPAGVTCRVLDDEGETAQLPHLRRLCAEHGLKMVSIDALAEHREAREATGRPVAVPSARPADA